MNKFGLLVPALCLASAPLWAAETSTDSVPAVWADKELTFVYLGFTTKYSCDGLRDKMRGVLLDLGADKKTLKVTQLGCSAPSGRPDPFPGVRAKLRVLQPASDGATNQTVAAQWKAVDLKLRDTVGTDSGECELVEQIRQKVLPLFSARNVEMRTNCIPHQASAVQPTLKLEVLAPAAAQHPAGEPPASQ